MEEFNVIEMGKKGRLSAAEQLLTSFVFLRLLDILANQQPIFNQAKQILTLWL